MFTTRHGGWSSSDFHPDAPTASVRPTGVSSQRHTVVEGVTTSSRRPMHPVTFIIIMAVVGIAFIGLSRWQTVGGDRHKLADRARTLDVLGKIVERQSASPIDTTQGVRNRPVDAQRRVARPLPAAFNMLGSSDVITPPPVSPRRDIPAPVIHRQMLRLTVDDVPVDPCDPASTSDTHHSHDSGDNRAEVTAPDGPQHTSDAPRRTLPWLRARTTPAAPMSAAATGPRSNRSPHGGVTPQASAPAHRRTRSRPHRRRQLVTVAAAVSLIAAVGVASNWDAMNTGGSTAGPTDAATPSNESIADTEPLDPPPASIPLAPGMVVGDVAAFDVAAPFTLDLAADQPSWVQVRNRSGEVLFEQTLQPGQSTQVDVDQPVAVRTGNPAGLAVTAGFVPLDHPRPAGQPITLHLG